MNQVYVCGTYFHVYVSVLKVLQAQALNSDERSLLVVNDLTPQIERLLEPLRTEGIFDFVVMVPFKKIEKRIKQEKSFLLRALHRNRYITSYVQAGSSINEYDRFILDAEINLFPDLGFTPAYFTITYPNHFFRMIEEGEGAYHLRVNKFKEFKRRHLLRTFVGGGLDAIIREIEVQYPDKLDARVKSKGRLLELKKMEYNLTVQNKEKIMRVFAPGINFKFLGKKKLLLITQPLEESSMAEGNKVNLYNQILDRYATDYAIYVKPHPREQTQYEGKLSYPFQMIPHSFPLELFDLFEGIRFELGITICSSALYNLGCVDKKIIFGREYLRKPLPNNWFELFS